MDWGILLPGPTDFYPPELGGKWEGKALGE